MDTALIQFVYVITQFVSVFLSILQFLMLVRAIMSWLPLDEDSNVVNFVMMVTEPVIVPVRMLLDRFEWVHELPIDISFLIAFMLLSILQMLLPGVI